MTTQSRDLYLWRRAYSLSQGIAARLAGVSTRTWAHWEADTTTPQPQHQVTLDRLLSTDWIPWHDHDTGSYVLVHQQVLHDRCQRARDAIRGLDPLDPDHDDPAQEGFRVVRQCADVLARWREWVAAAQNATAPEKNAMAVLTDRKDGITVASMLSLELQRPAATPTPLGEWKLVQAKVPVEDAEALANFAAQHETSVSEVVRALARHVREDSG